jgi:hypothetical protein
MSPPARARPFTAQCELPPGAALDHLVGDGAYNWQIQFNLTFLRLISFCIDRFWSLAPADQQQQQRPAKSSIIGLSGASDSIDAERAEELRADERLPASKYCLLPMLAYVFYIPLYIAGPIVPFNTFARCTICRPLSLIAARSCFPRDTLMLGSCMQRRQQSHTPPVLLRMLLRALGMAVVLDISLHYLYPAPAPLPPPPTRPAACSDGSAARSFLSISTSRCVHVLRRHQRKRPVRRARPLRAHAPGGGFLGRLFCPQLYVRQPPPPTPTSITSITSITAAFRYLKFTAIWRFFRVWALADGVCVPVASQLAR